MHRTIARLALVATLLLVSGTMACTNRTNASRASLAPAPQLASLRGSHASPAIGAFVRDRNAQLQLCYDDARVQQATLAGKATIGVTLADDGRVLAASILDRTWRGGSGDGVERCLLGTVRRWRFPELDTDQQHAHTFSVVFSS